MNKGRLESFSDGDGPSNAAMIKALHDAKWHLWHGCPYQALRRLESLGWDMDAEASPEEAKLLGKLEEFIGYLGSILAGQRLALRTELDLAFEGLPLAPDLLDKGVGDTVDTMSLTHDQVGR
ncbi:hypothetical protein [Cupriavidus sp. SK-3]|uniref:hypothetical protein n=1 Tax=Cupriavidus sp. SK-3 TaxID=1470558 RepID=UPI000A83A332|nr:hypothetical protein [Cupriavidus sp. SK-3]